jgi:hypothetical protein
MNGSRTMEKMEHIDNINSTELKKNNFLKNKKVW